MLNSGSEYPASSEVVVAVPALQLQNCKAKFAADIAVSAQDVSIMDGLGAYTGEISAKLLVDSGINWTIVGHSERRAGFGYSSESNETVGKKAKVALDNGMSTIICIGERLDDRETGTTMEVCSAQLSAIVAELSASDWKNVVIAYEPVWAIGTGKCATPSIAEETHSHIRGWISDNLSPEIANATRIIYGGSVKGKTAPELIACSNIDGFLVGGASLLPEFKDIIRCAEKI